MDARDAYRTTPGQTEPGSTKLQTCDDAAAGGAGHLLVDARSSGAGRVLTRLGLVRRSALEELEERAVDLRRRLLRQVKQRNQRSTGRNRVRMQAATIRRGRSSPLVAATGQMQRRRSGVGITGLPAIAFARGALRTARSQCLQRRRPPGRRSATPMPREDSRAPCCRLPWRRHDRPVSAPGFRVVSTRCIARPGGADAGGQ
jgi:hypothetical protein